MKYSKCIIPAVLFFIFSAAVGCAAQGDEKPDKRYVITDYGALADGRYR